MKIISILVLMTFLTLTTFAQIIPDSAKNQLYTLEISELKAKRPLRNEREYAYGYDLGIGFYFAGNIKLGVAQLFGYPHSRIRVKGKMPDLQILYQGTRPPRDWTKKQKETLHFGEIEKTEKLTDPVNQMILSVLESRYNFTVEDFSDTVEVWVAKVVDSAKLSGFRSGREHGDGSAGPHWTKDGTVTNWSIDNYLLETMWQALEQCSSYIVYDETKDQYRYNIKKFDNEAFYNFDTMNREIEQFGLKIYKEKHLEKLKLIEFHE